MTGLIAKKLMRLPIGTGIEVSYEPQTGETRRIGGVITDSDFTSSLEITAADGENLLLEFDLVKSVSITAYLEDTLKTLPVGTKIRFSHGDAEKREPDTAGVVSDNDGESALEIQLGKGRELVLDYGEVRSLVTESPVASAPKTQPAPVPEPIRRAQDEVRPQPAVVAPQPELKPKKAKEPPVVIGMTKLCSSEPEDRSKLTDRDMKTVFDGLPKADRTRLNGAWDSYMHGIKVTDPSKIRTAAKNAKKIYDQEKAQGKPWSADASKLVGAMLRRVGQNDADLFLEGRWYEIAGCVANAEKNDTLGAACAVLAMLQQDEARWDNQLRLLAVCCAKADDFSGLRILYSRLTPAFRPRLAPLVREAILRKGAAAAAETPLPEALDVLDGLYPNTTVTHQVLEYLDAQPEPAQPAAAPEEVPAEAAPAPEVQAPAPDPVLLGYISKLQWVSTSGKITGEDGTQYNFTYSDIVDGVLKKTIQACLNANLNGRTYYVHFTASNGAARDIVPADSPLKAAKQLPVSADDPDSYRKAFDLCRFPAVTPEAGKAVACMAELARALHTNGGDASLAQETVQAFDQLTVLYSEDAQDQIHLAHCFAATGNTGKALEYLDKAGPKRKGTPRFRTTLLMKELMALSAVPEKDKTVYKRIIKTADQWEEIYRKEMERDGGMGFLFRQYVLPPRITAKCCLNQLAAAEADFEQLGDGQRMDLADLMEETRARLAPKEAAPEELEDTWVPEPDLYGDPEGEDQDLEEDQEDLEDTPEEETVEAEPYVDREGWKALGLTEEQVSWYAMDLTAAGKIPQATAYLKAASNLNPRFQPLYQLIAMAAKDPLLDPDYSTDALLNTLPGGEPDWPLFSEGCRTAVFLRASFQGRIGFDYVVQGLRQELSMVYTMPSLGQVLADMEEFREAAGSPLDIYADYRNRNAGKLQGELQALQKEADELYTKLVLTNPRDATPLARLLETKRLLFAKDGRLAQLLLAVRDGDRETLAEARERFAQDYLNGGQISLKNVTESRVDALIDEYWTVAGENMQMKKANATLQGSRRNNMRSSISSVLYTICRWYNLMDQQADSDCTQQGREVYQRLQPRLLEDLERVAADCADAMAMAENTEEQAGYAVLQAAAEELSARLNGRWDPTMEKFFYADFLRGDEILLDEHFLPELDSTFSALPAFHILARIRRHCETPGLEDQDHLNEIYGKEKTRNNYGTAARILEYRRAQGTAEDLVLPDRAEEYWAQTEGQARMKLGSFLEMYALAMNYGQIMQSDDFCCNLENTVKYWFLRAQHTGNFGFFHEIVTRAENQIHTSAQQYEQQLDGELDALVAGNRAQFDAHPDYEEAIRTQIQQQNFLVAEDWMHRIRVGDFSMEIQQPVALEYLAQFWNSFPRNFERVSDSGRQVSTLLARRGIVHNKDMKGAQQLINSWLNSGTPSSTPKIQQLLGLLGWNNLTVEHFRFEPDPRMEVYRVTREPNRMGVSAPLHPIAAFGSGLEQDGMYVCCLYGVHDCDRLFRKIQALDVLNGNKLILVDCALGNLDRRALAMKLKKRSNGLQNVYLVVDRVLLCFLADNYTESTVNQMLMAAGMPFSYCQPYVAESSHTMPPEIFIGRRDELLKIKSPSGVNLIYGGRQLGKSALFKKARSDLDGRQQQRAVFVDIKDLDSCQAAEKVSQELTDTGVLPPGSETDDWGALCRSIKQRLRSTEDEIKYLLVMMDEADRFIDDCSSLNYRPLVELKDVQQSLPGHFKFVMAGLHNIVRFNRDVALGRNGVINHFPSLKITPFLTPDAQQLLTEPLSYLGFSLPDKVIISQILATTNYFPGLIQLYCQKLIESIRGGDYAGYDFKKTPPYVVSVAHLRRVMMDRDFVDEIHSKFEITLMLDQDQGSYYYAVGLLFSLLYKFEPDKAKSGYSARDVLHHARDLGVETLMDLDEEKVETLLQELQDLNILRGVGPDTYLFASKNFRSLLGSEDKVLEKLSKIGGSEA